MQLSTISQSATMSSREIAELVGATHDSVLKTVRRTVVANATLRPPLSQGLRVWVSPARSFSRVRR